MKEFFKNLRRYKVSSVLNILGLGIAFAAAYIIMVQVNFDLGYNRCLKDAERIYRLEFKSVMGNEDKKMPHVSHAVGEAVGDNNANVEEYAWAFPYLQYYDLTIGKEEPQNPIATSVCICSPNFPKLFNIPFIAGSYEELEKPNSVIISENFAKIHDLEVGDAIVFGAKYLSYGNKQTVIGIYPDFPDNCEFGNTDAFQLTDKNILVNKDEFAFSYYYKVYDAEQNNLMLANGMRLIAWDFGEAYEEVREAYEKDDPDTWMKVGNDFMRLTSVYDIYFTNDVEGMIGHNVGNRFTTYTLLSIAILILAIAFINFVNFFMAMVPRRIRRVNTEKVFGCTTRRLRMGFVFEAMGLVALGLLLAIYIIFMVAPELTGMVSTSVALRDNPKTLLFIIIAGLMLAVVSSIYPAYYITSVPPAFALKGSFGNTAVGRRMRYVLLTIQFVISIALITCTLFIRLQHSYMMRYDMGFNKENVLAVDLSTASKSRWDFNARQQLANELKTSPMIADVAFAVENFIEPVRSTHNRTKENSEHVFFQAYYVSYNFLPFMGIELIEGRDYTPEDEQQDDKQLYIFNETAQKEYDLRVYESLNGAAVIGFCKDFKFRPLQYEHSAFAFCVSEATGFIKHCYVRTTENADIEAVEKHIKECVTKMGDDADKIIIEFFDKELARQYEKEKELNRLITIFSIISICISLMGVFGLVFFETQYRRREIAVRRVHGAKIGQILGMFVGQYAKMVLVAFLFAVPVSYLIMQRWLQGYAYHIPLYWWVFALALLIVLAVTSAIVLARSWRAAKENPVEALYKE